MKAWDGRFKKGTEPLMERFSSSIAVDNVLFPYDITGSIAYAEMLLKIGILSQKERTLLVGALKEVRNELEEGSLPFSDALEDIHMHIEARLIEKVGDLGKKLHTGRSRNDQVAVDMRMFLKDAMTEIDTALKKLLAALLDKAGKEKRTMMPGYTHTRRAQVVTFSHYLLAYFSMLKRDRQRVKETLMRIDVLPLGSGALAGSTIPIDREFLKKRLGFAKIAENSMDAVSDRDYLLDSLFSLSVIMTHLSRLSEDLILFSTEEFGFVSPPDGLCTGSSLMPHKKNPDALELIRGKAARTTGDLTGMFTLLKGLPLTYNRDLQEDKEPVFRAVATTSASLEIMALAIEGLSVHREKMEEAVVASFMPAVEMAEYLVLKEVPFREAHHIVGRMVRYCEEQKKRLAGLTLEEMKGFSAVFADDVRAYIDPATILKNRKTVGGASHREVTRQIAREKNYLRH
ncbi:MAG TPA: argininosuccinate lyase [Syntrophorhabdales bacterium]|nr:argininosuccinate lyase [Syntrophorhabdales bacterium]